MSFRDARETRGPGIQGCKFGIWALDSGFADFVRAPE
ncbi:hypothetical protein DFP91_3955 [Pseudorhodoplanes sinuspersici]|nr:hypothetical protein DFP91_3955 [Pseudorhodoplanes sinuspersici]